MEFINTYLSGYIMPLLLMGTGLFFGIRTRFFYVLHPLDLTRELKSTGKGSGISPKRALTQALAGTLGVGNMTGVASAVCQGGAGAVFWMWMSALLAMSIKYFEVALAVKCRRRDGDGYYGGAMYYIRDIFKDTFPRLCRVLGISFALLCIVNSLLTGNIVQINSAAGALENIPPIVTGVLCALLTLPVVLGKGKRISAVTLGLIPFLSILYIVISLIIIVPQAPRLPRVLSEIFEGAFSLRAAGGGAGGYLIARAIRFGTTRGIFSNEAGSGTSPTAHASAEAKSPHAQGCFGIFEVFADTIVLCSLTAFVILLSDGCAKGLDGIRLTVYAFSSQAGSTAGTVIAISVLLFAYATVICQTGYGTVALQSITKRKSFFYCYIALSFTATVFGAIISQKIMWQAADLVISLMTVLNVLCLIAAEKKGYLKSVLTSNQHIEYLK